jgi:hypothetical protein
MSNEATVLILSTLVVITFFKDSIASQLERLKLKWKFRGGEADYHAERIMASLERLSSEVLLQQGQLSAAIDKLQRLEALMGIATGEDAAKQANLYMEGLGALTRSSNASLEKQERIENLLIQIVGSLKKLVD